MFYIQFKKNLIEKVANSSFSLISSFLVSDVSDSLTISHFLWEMWANRSGCSPKMSDVSGSLRSLTKNEQPWAIRSHRSEEMSDCERIAQVAHQKWANEWIAHFFEQIAHSLIFGQKTSNSFGNQMSEFPALEPGFPTWRVFCSLFCASLRAWPRTRISYLESLL